MNNKKMDHSSTMNLVDSVIDEVALEGLDGITLEALWSRLAVRFHQKDPLSSQLMEQVWNICLHVKEFSFYELEKERNKLIIFDRYEFVDPDLGIILEAENPPEDIYTHCLIDDCSNGIKGSSATYYTRKDVSHLITEKLTVHDVEKQYGRKLIIVASQSARQSALMDKSVPPTLGLTPIQYCVLERVGRSRYHGEVTQGKLSLSLLNEDPRLLFYHRKFLIRHKLLTKQAHHQKSGGHSCTGSLLHLPRFYVERKPKAIYLAEKVLEILKSRENHLVEYSEIKKELKIDNCIKKLFKTPFFLKFVKTNMMVPWRTLYPHATNKEWQSKQNPAKEKMLRAIQLVDPNLDINDLWKDEIIVEDDEPYELDISQHQYSVPYLKQANMFVEQSKHEGTNQFEVAKKMGLPKILSRTAFRIMAKTNIVATYMKDVGRQRVTRYVSRKFESGSELSTQFQRELTKMKKYTETPPEKVIETKETPVVDEKSSIDENDKTSNVIEAEDEKIDAPSSSNISSFNAAAKVIKKYKLKSCKGHYKRTFCNVAEKGSKFPESKRRKLMPDLSSKNEQPVDEKIETTEILDENQEVEEKLIVSRYDKPREPSNDIIGLKDLTDPNSNTANITYRLLKRANIIMEIVREHIVVDDLTKLLKAISEEEEKEGYDGKIDKKSLIRLLQRLAKDNLVKNIKLNLKANDKEKTLTFICDPSIHVNHTVIRSAIEQAKVKFCLVGKGKTMPSSAEKSSNPENKNETESMEKSNTKSKTTKKNVPPGLVEDSKAGRRYGYAEKFVRMQTLHSFLFYVIYEHPGKSRKSKEEKIEILKSNGVKIDETLEKEMTEIFNTEMNWKMFVPPLPKHSGWPRGWTIMCDIVLRMPLSIFLKIHNVTYSLPLLDDYMNHPIKKHFLMKDVPTEIRDVLFLKRRYVYSIHETIQRLCYIGLLQFGPHKFKEKEKVFMYVNRETELLDTTSSAAHYHQIEAKAYPVMTFTFTSSQVVDEYWYKLWATCINTRLGGRLVVQGKDIVLEDLTKKPEMIEATNARAPEEAPLMDVGHVPGDRKGAAGLDSAFFAHLKRNWNRESANHAFQKLNGQSDRERNQDGERDVHLAKVKPKPIRFTDYHGLKKVTGPTVIDAVDLRKAQTKNSNASSSWKSKQQNRLALTKNAAKDKKISYVRRVLPRRQQVRSRVKYDEIDYSALQRMNKLRVDWDTQEDNILLVCKVAIMYLCPNPRRQMIPFTAVRDVLRSYSLTSYNKTSRACQRRLLYMLKQPETHHSVTLGVEELKQDFYVKRRFGDVVEKLTQEQRPAQQIYEKVSLIFRDLVNYIAKKHFDIKDIQSSTLNVAPTTIEEFLLYHRVKHPKRTTSLQGFYDETTNDIHSATINSVIHSSMCCVKDRRSWAYQLFRIYQQYPEWLLRNAMAKIRADQMVTIKKHYVVVMRKQSNACMPMSSSQYQLSSGYIQKFNTKLPFSVFREAWDFFFSLAKHYNENYLENPNEKNVEMIASPINGGTIAAIHDYLNMSGLEFDMEIPQHIIMLDPTLKKDDERYIRIAHRYQAILRNLEHINIDEILDRDYAQESRDEGLDEPPTKEISMDSTKNKQEKEKPQKSLSQPKNKESVNLDSEVRKTRQAKNQDAIENNGNTDNEANESEHEVSSDEEDCEDDIEDTDYEDDHVIRFIDGTTVRLTREDFENCGFEVSSENFRPPKETTMKKTTTKEKPPVEQNEVAPMEIDDDSNESNPVENKSIAEKTAMEIDEDSKESNPVESKSATEKTSMEIALPRDDEMFKVEGSESGAVRISQILERADSGKLDRLPCLRTSDSNDMQKRYTRLAMLQMREELNDLASSDTHHAHEYFVLNMFPIFYSLSREKIQRPEDLSNIHGVDLPSELLPISREVYGPVIAELKKMTIFTKADLPYEKFREDLQASDIFKRGLDAVYEFIQDKREVGANISELVKKFYSILGEQLYDMILLLKDNRFLLRSGVTNTRYIHQTYTDPWLIHSYKIMRLQKEGLQTIMPGSLYVVSEEKSKDEEENKQSKDEIEADVTKKILEGVESHEIAEPMEEDEIEELKKSDHNPDDPEAGKSNPGKIQKSRTCLLPTKDIYRAAKQLDLDTAEEIKVVVRPWVRIDGALNRRVLDRMLGAVLAYCLVRPGVYLTKVQEKFAPAIQPFHTKQLVEMLMKLGCLQMGSMRKSRVTLFSKSFSAKPAFSCVPERGEFSEEELVIEPVLGATMKFSVFLSNRTYTSDFLS